MVHMKSHLYYSHLYKPSQMLALSKFQFNMSSHLSLNRETAILYITKTSPKGSQRCKHKHQTRAKNTVSYILYMEVKCYFTGDAICLNLTYHHRVVWR